jgi:transposase
MQIQFLNTEIKDTKSKISYQASKNESVKILMSMTGIDHFSAMLIASEIGDITRFSTPDKLVPWSGLCPSKLRKFSLHGKDERWKQEGEMEHSSKKRR